MLKPAGTEKDSSSGRWSRFKPVGGSSRTVTDKRRDITSRGEERLTATRNAELSNSMLPRKAAGRVYRLTVPQTDTGRQGEYPKALERTLVKELGKLTP